jgi:hypothetical protein
MPVNIYAKLRSAFGGQIVDANVVEVAVAGFTGKLATSPPTDVQALAADVDTLAYNATEISVNATGFNGNLATTDDTVQKVAQALDDLAFTAGDISVTATGFNGNLTTGDDNVQKVAQAVDDLTFNASQISVDATGFDGNLSTTDDTVQEVAQALDDLTLTSLPRLTALTFATSLTINQTNVSLFVGRDTIYTASADQDVTVNLPTNTVTGVTFPFSLRFIHVGGTARSNTTNRVTLQATGGNTILFNGNSVTSITLQLGDSLELEYRASGAQIIALRSAGIDPTTAVLPSGVFRFNTRSLDVSSAAAFTASLGGFDPQTGDAFRVRVGGSPFTDAPTLVISSNDTLVSLVNSPSVTTSTDWLIISSATPFSLSGVAAAFLQNVNEVDDREFVRLLDLADETRVRYWLRSAVVTPANVSSPDVGLIITEANGDLDDNAQQFQDDQDSSDTFVYITTTAGTGAGSFDFIENSAQEFQDSLFLQVVNPDGVVVQSFPFETNFVRQTDLALASTNVYRMTSGGLGGSILRYKAGQTIRLVVTQVGRTYGLDTPDVNVTQNVIDLPEENTSEEVRAKLNSPQDDPYLIQFFENSVTAVSTLSPSESLAAVTMHYRPDHPSNLLTDYTAGVGGDGLPPSFGTAKRWFVLFPPDYDVTNFTGVESGVVNPVRLLKSPVNGTVAYEVTIPVGGTNANLYQPQGQRTSISSLGIDPVFKIDRNNLTSELLAAVQRTANPNLSDALQDFEDNLSVAHTAEAAWRAPANPTRHRASAITREFAMFWDENRQTFTGNYFEDLVDPTITFDANDVSFFTDGNAVQNTRFPGKQSYVTGGVQVQGTGITSGGLTTGFQKIIGMSFFVPQTFADTVRLFQAGSGALQRILRLNGNVLQGRVGNRDGAANTISTTELLTDTIGQTTQHFAGSAGGTFDFIVPNEVAIPQVFTVNVNRINNGNPDATFGTSISVTDRNTATAIQNETAFQAQSPDPQALTFTIQYLPDQDIGGGVLENVIRLVYTAHGGTQFSYTTTVSFSASADEAASLTGTWADIETINVGQENSILFLIERTNGASTDADPHISLKLAVNGRSENNHDISLPQSNFDWDNLIFGDRGVNAGRESVSEIQVYGWDDGGNPFNAPTHQDMYNFFQARERWLGLFIHPSFSYSTYTIDGNAVLTDTDDTTFDVIAQLKAAGTGRTVRQSQTFTPAASVAVSLPTGTTLSDFVLMEIEWNTGQTDASASDNDHRRYSDTTMVIPIIDASGPNVILSARGRGAENFGVRITSALGTATSVSIEVINLNDAGGAILPTGTQITKVWFY